MLPPAFATVRHKLSGRIRRCQAGGVRGFARRSCGAIGQSPQVCKAIMRRKQAELADVTVFFAAAISNFTEDSAWRLKDLPKK